MQCRLRVRVQVRFLRVHNADLGAGPHLNSHANRQEAPRLSASFALLPSVGHEKHTKNTKISLGIWVGNTMDICNAFARHVGVFSPQTSLALSI